MAHPTAPPTCLLLTATIQVREDIRASVRRDAAVRLEDYKGAFRKWLSHPEVETVVFAENSGYDLAAFSSIAREFPSKRVELLSFECPPFDGGNGGKSYGEMLIFEHCLAHSELLRVSPRFLKATGRFYLANCGSLFALLRRRELDAVCNFYRDLTWADSRVFGGSSRLLSDFLLPLRDQIDENRERGIEQLLARAVHTLLGQGGSWSPTPEPLQIEGVSGTVGKVWTQGRFARSKARLRHRLLLNLLAR